MSKFVVIVLINIIFGGKRTRVIVGGATLALKYSSPFHYTYLGMYVNEQERKNIAISLTCLHTCVGMHINEKVCRDRVLINVIFGGKRARVLKGGMLGVKICLSCRHTYLAMHVNEQRPKNIAISLPYRYVY